MGSSPIVCSITKFYHPLNGVIFFIVCIDFSFDILILALLKVYLGKIVPAYIFYVNSS